MICNCCHQQAPDNHAEKCLNKMWDRFNEVIMILQRDYDERFEKLKIHLYAEIWKSLRDQLAAQGKLLNEKAEIEYYLNRKLEKKQQEINELRAEKYGKVNNINFNPGHCQ